jgi:G8 domain
MGASGPETCNNSGHILPAGDVNTDLQISGGTGCIIDGRVPGGNYVYRNVNIWGGGSLTFNDAKINFHAHSILVENQGTLQAGLAAPVAGPISIWLYGSKDDGIPSITCQSSPTCGVSPAIWNSNPLVANNVSMGTMTMPTEPCIKASTIDPTTPVGTDCFYQYEVFDRGDAAGAFFGKKVLAVSYGGILFLRGQKGIREVTANGPAIDATPSDSGTSWVRLNQTIATANLGTTSLYVDRAVPTWQAGDQIVVTSTDYLPAHSEELTIASISSDTNGTKITVNPPGVQYPHWGEAYDFSSFPATTGPRDDQNRPETQASRHLENRAAVALLTRSILIQSEGQNPVLQDRNTTDPNNDPHFPLSAGYYGGHTLVRDGFAEFQVQGVEFANLGQGGEIGHYPVHFHMARTVPPPTTVPQVFAGTYLADSSVHDSNTRFVTIHATQGVLVARNVGYRSIGHGYYLEDATEINNRLYSNIGIQALAAVNSAQNTRMVPGIFSQPGNSEAEVVPFHSDFDHPSIFWIMNTWNDFRYNVAVGAGTCGVCYWTLPATNSGYSVYETWDSYAAIQAPGSAAGAGSAPMMNFIGNSCSAAMTAFQSTGVTTPCFGVTSSDVSQTGKLQAIANPDPLPAASYPTITDKRVNATLCDATTQDCTKVAPCSGASGQEANCAVTTLDHFSTSFNWAQLNFASVLLRGWWYLLKDSAITDVQNGGLQMVTGGGYSRSDAAQGFWSLSTHNLFVGNTQPIIPGTSDGGVPDNPFASNAGPFNPYALNSGGSPDCPFTPNGPSFCTSASQGIAFENAGFSNSQRMLNIYDGPTFEDSDAFSDIHTLNIGTLGKCRPDGNTSSGSCQSLGWMNAYTSGVIQSPGGNLPANHCILPNAAISWKQPNGFYYPPAFDSQNLYFDPSVDIRHFVIDPLWKPGGFSPNGTAAMNTYCSWQIADFTNFTDVDRQTELTDLDGSLTGLLSGTSSNNLPTISVNNDPISDPTSPVFDPTASSNFFRAPVITAECASSVTGQTPTVNTSPYEYVTTAMYPACAGSVGYCANWGQTCTNQTCYGVPLYRQYLTVPEYSAWQSNNAMYPSIRMMGQNLGQRSTLTMNHGSYYIDTTVPSEVQKVANQNVFVAGQSYYIYVLYAKPTLHQTYSLYIGTGLSQAEALATVVTGIVTPWAGLPITFTAETFNGSPDWIQSKTYNATTGVLSITLDLSAQTSVFAAAQSDSCQPASYCSVNTAGACACNPANAQCTDNSVCSWATKEIDCPSEGCFGFSVTLPSTFQTATAAQPIPPPPPVLFTASGDSYFAPGNIQFYNVPESISGSQCYYSNPPNAPARRGSTAGHQ